MTIHPTPQINAAELISRLEKSRDEWLEAAADCEKKQLPKSQAMGLHIADGLQEAIDEVREMAK